jgi:hypothetical protein
MKCYFYLGTCFVSTAGAKQSFASESYTLLFLNYKGRNLLIHNLGFAHFRERVKRATVQSDLYLQNSSFSARVCMKTELGE